MVGSGPPLQVRTRRGVRGFHDGGGLCSPGRWPPARRRYPRQAEILREPLLDALRRIQAATDLRKLLYFLASGKVTQCPFPPDPVESLRASWRGALQRRGWRPTRHEKDRGQQPIQVRLLQATLGFVGDPDVAFLDKVAVGVPIGYDELMPRTPDVFEEQCSWRLPEMDEEYEAAGKRNYSTTHGKEATLAEKFQEDVKLGRMQKLTPEEARRRYGDRLRVAALGAIPKGESGVRIIFDGTHAVAINNAIRPRDRLRYPTAQDLETEGPSSPARAARTSAWCSASSRPTA